MNLSTNIQLNILLVSLLFSTLIGVAVFNSISVIFILRVSYEIIKNKNTIFFKQKWIKLVFIFYTILIISSILSEHVNDIFLKSIFLLRFLLIAVCIQYCLQKFNKVNLFLYTIMIMTLFVAVDSSVQYLFGTNLFGNNLNVETFSRIRLTSVFGDEEIVGAYLIKFISLGTIGCFFMFKKNRVISFSYFTFLSMIILLSQERMAFLLLGLLIFIIFIYHIWNKNIKFSIITVIISLIVITSLFVSDDSLKARYLSIFTSASGLGKLTYDDSKKPINNVKKISDLKNFEISIRDSLWGAHYITAYQIFKDNIIFGSGTRSFRYECGKDKYKNLDIHYIEKRCSTHPHNYYLEILSETGILGFVYLLIILTIFYYQEIKFFIKDRNYKHLFGLLSIFVNLWPIASTGSAYSSFNGLIIWITIGYIFSFSKKNDLNLS